MNTTVCNFNLQFLLFVILSSCAVTDAAFRGEHITTAFYIAGEIADHAKDTFREILDMFYLDDELRENTLQLNEFLKYLESVSNSSVSFAVASENFFSAAKNESDNLLQKFQQPPSSKYEVTRQMDHELAEYYNEMDNFVGVLFGILEDVMEFSIDSVEIMQSTLTEFANMQTDIMQRCAAKTDELCHKHCSGFLEHAMAEVYQCASGQIRIMFDIYTITKVSTYHILKMLEHRIQKLYNCFLFGKYPMRCRFMKNGESDLERLYTRMDELQMYNEKQKRKIYGISPREGFTRCIPERYPESQMSKTLRSCLYVSP